MQLPLRRIASLAMVILVIAGWFTLFGPTSLGGPTTYVAVSGTSMEPGLLEGDLVVARRADRYEPGDVVVFRVPEGEPAAGGLVIHRIVGGSAAGFVVQGDNKGVPDPWRPSATDIAGTLWLRLPGAAVALTWLRQPAVFAAVAAALTAFVVMYGGSTSARGSAPAGVSGVREVGTDVYRWTLERGLAVCGGSSTRVAPGSIRRPREPSTGDASAHPFRWTVARGQAVCRTAGTTMAIRAAATEG